MSIISVKKADCQLKVGDSLSVPMFDNLFKQSMDYAVSQLSRLFNLDLSVALINLHSLSLSWILQQIEDDKRFQNAVHSRVSGDLTGEMFLFFPRESACRLVQLGLKRSYNSLFLSRLEESVLNELTNILVNSFWENFCRKLDARWWISPPATLNRPLGLLSQYLREDILERIVFLAELQIVNTQTPLMLLFLPSQETLTLFQPYL